MLKLSNMPKNKDNDKIILFIMWWSIKHHGQREFRGLDSTPFVEKVEKKALDNFKFCKTGQMGKIFPWPKYACEVDCTYFDTPVSDGWGGGGSLHSGTSSLSSGRGWTSEDCHIDIQQHKHTRKTPMVLINMTISQSHIIQVSMTEFCELNYLVSECARRGFYLTLVW